MKHWKFVAVLMVQEIMSNHQQAAFWYLKNNNSIPKNCVVNGNPPLDSNESILSKEKSRIAEIAYKNRAIEFSQYNICKAVYKNLKNPSPIFEEDFISIFGKVPGTQTPRETTREQLDQLLQLALQRQ